MILVKDVEVVECKGNMAEIIFADKYGFQNFPLDLEIKKEICYGRRFTNQNGEEVLLGISKKAQDILGLPFEQFERMSKKISELEELHYNDCIFINRIMRLNFWGRLKFAFTKIISDR